MDKAEKIYEGLVKQAAGAKLISYAKDLMRAGKNLLKDKKQTVTDKIMKQTEKVLRQGVKGTAKAVVRNKKVQLAATAGGGFAAGRLSKKSKKVEEYEE
jgi:tRNA A22 N-methylase